MTDQFDGKELLEHKWVRIMCDYCADGVWAKGGGGMSVEDLPVPDHLRERLRGWQALFESYDTADVHDRGEKTSIDWKAFDETGLAIAIDIKKYLPDWTVVFHSETCVPEGYELGDDRSAFEFEIGPERVKLEMLLTKELTIRHTPGTDGLWSKHDEPIDARDLPLSSEALLFFEAWSALEKSIERQVHQALDILQEELPGWKIHI